MRRFTDENGATWEVVAGRESWGSIFAIFIPVGGGEMRQVPLSDVSGYEVATSRIDRFTEDDLNVMLRESVPKTMG